MQILLFHHSTGKQWTAQKLLFHFFKKKKKTTLIESVRGMLYKIYHPFVYGIHVTRSWLRLTLCLDRISSNFQYSMTARSKELIIKIHGDNSKVFHCEVELSTRNVTAAKLALPNTPSFCCLSFRLIQNITMTWSHQTARWLQNAQTWLLQRKSNLYHVICSESSSFWDTDKFTVCKTLAKKPPTHN